MKLEMFVSPYFALGISCGETQDEIEGKNYKYEFYLGITFAHIVIYW